MSSQLSAAARHTIEDWTSPLLEDAEKADKGTATVSDDDEYFTQGAAENSEDISYKNLTAAEWLKFVGVAIAAGAGAAASISTFLVAPAVIVFVAGGVNLCNVPAVWLKEWKLSIVPAVRRKISSLRVEANRLQSEVDVLLGEVETLQTEADRMRSESEKLERVVQLAGAKVDECVELVNENQRIIMEMRSYMRQVVAQDVVKQVIRSDLDHDGIINEREARILQANMAVSLQNYGIVFDTEKLHRAIALSPSLGGVIRVVKRLLPDEKNRRASFYDLASDDEEDEDEEEKEEGEEDGIYNMFYMSADAAKQMGCAETIRLCKEYQEKHGKVPMYLSMSMRLKCSGGVRCSMFKGCSAQKKSYEEDKALLEMEKQKAQNKRLGNDEITKEKKERTSIEKQSNSRWLIDPTEFNDEKD